MTTDKTPSEIRKSKAGKFEDIASGLDLLAEEAWTNSEAHGFHDDLNEIRTLVVRYGTDKHVKALDVQFGLARLMLITTEIAEAAEALRHDDKANYVEELGDAVIRIGDEAYRQDVALGSGTIEKMAVNIGRPPMHGKLA